MIIRTGALPPEGLITGRAVPTALRGTSEVGVSDQGFREPSASICTLSEFANDGGSEHG
jgi:hypothetical protein